MYTIIERRTINQAKVNDTMARAQSKFFPKLNQAPGFVSFYLVPDTDQGVFTAIIVWESKEHADAFEPEAERWAPSLDADGHTLLSMNRGETAVSIEAKR